MDFTQDEMMLMLLHSPGTRTGLIAALEKIQRQLQPDETELADMTASTLAKLRQLTDADFARIDLYAVL